MNTKPIQPMLAVPMSKGVVTNWNEWVAEEKYDGHRLVVEVAVNVRAWTRPRKHAGGAGKTMEPRALPGHLVEAFKKMPTGIYDGELMAVLPDGTWGTATDVTRLDLQGTLRFVVFDLLELNGIDTTRNTWGERHLVLHRMFDELRSRASLKDTLQHVSLATPRDLTSQDDVEEFFKRVRAQGGEGLILKRRTATYQAGKRSKDMIKVKRLEHAVGTIIGFEATRGSVMQRGQFAVVKLRTDDGHELTLKTKDDDEIAMFEKEAVSAYAKRTGKHPSIGRRLMFNYPFRTREGNYQGPIIWDRWAEEGE